MDLTRNNSVARASHNNNPFSAGRQDDLAEQFCGEGIPAWAVDTTGAFAWLPFPMGVTDITAGFNASQYENASIHGHSIPTRQACALHDWGSMQARHQRDGNLPLCQQRVESKTHSFARPV
jgi:hypothetical protein